MVDWKRGMVVRILEDIHFRDVLAMGVVTSDSRKLDRRVDVYIPDINASRAFTRARLQLVPPEEL